MTVKTTLKMSSEVMRALKREAIRRQCTMSELVETALRSLLEKGAESTGSLPELPSFDGGGCRVDVSDRDALYRAMEGR
ncbi:MAG: ribbon-helix-helix protein, CopG family [Candidatus Riflebacteria bacterium]|nr:ribbon-helix-helix protein, CopG family [Candidatus Riflebacteria bacterium]